MIKSNIFKNKIENKAVDILNSLGTEVSTNNVKILSILLASFGLDICMDSSIRKDCEILAEYYKNDPLMN